MTIAWYDPTNHHVSTYKNDPSFTPLGQLWPLVVKREWVGLTDEEVELYWDWEDFQIGAGRSTILEMVRDIEAKLKDKNNAA